MAYERKFNTIPAQLLTTDGGKEGQITVADTSGYHVKQQITIFSNTRSPIIYQVQRVNSSTDLVLGILRSPIESFVDLTLYLVSDAATVSSPGGPRPAIGFDDHARASYEEEPVAAVRTFGVDQQGNPYTSENPFPTNTTATIEGPLDVDLNGLNKFQTNQFTVGTSAIQLIPPLALANRSSINVKATTSPGGIVYVGNSSGVTTSNGYALFNGDAVSLDLTNSDPVWVVSNLANQTVYFMEMGK